MYESIQFNVILNIGICEQLLLMGVGMVKQKMVH